MAKSLTLWKRVRRTPYQAITSVFMVFVTLLVTGIFLCLALTSSALISYFETKPQLTVFFTDEKDKSSIDALTEKLKATAKVSSTVYISKDEALKIYREQNKNDPLLLEMVTADVLPASLEISAVSPKYLVELSDLVKGESGVDEVVFQKDVVDTLINWTTTIRKVGILFIIFLLIATQFILLTTVGIKIALQREEIEILTLVGATSWYIKKPFIAEGILYGLSGAILSSFVISVLVLYVRPFVSSFLKGIPDLSLIQFSNVTVTIWPPNLPFFGLLWTIILLFGFMIGFIGSLIAVSRYIKY